MRTQEREQGEGREGELAEPEEAGCEEGADGEEESDDALCECRLREDSQQCDSEDLAQVVKNCDHCEEYEEPICFRIQPTTPIKETP